MQLKYYLHCMLAVLVIAPLYGMEEQLKYVGSNKLGKSMEARKKERERKRNEKNYYKYQNEGCFDEEFGQLEKEAVNALQRRKNKKTNKPCILILCLPNTYNA